MYRSANVGIPAPERWVRLRDAQGRSDGVSDGAVAAAGEVSEAFKWFECARRLYDLHQMLGYLDLQMSGAVELLGEARHVELADVVDAEGWGGPCSTAGGRSSERGGSRTCTKRSGVVEERVSDELVLGSAGTSTRRK